MHNKLNTIKCIGTCLAISCLSVGVVNADTANSNNEQILFPQTVIFDTTGVTTGFTTDDLIYHYSLTPVTDEDVLALDAGSGGTVYAGDEDGLTLVTTALTIEGFIVDPNSTDIRMSENITFEVDDEAFDLAGIYRYELIGTSGDYEQRAYVDVYVADGQEPIVNFYDEDSLDDDEIVKLIEFTDEIDVDEVAGRTEQRAVVFRFVDENGNLIADDVQVTQDFVISDPSVEFSRKDGRRTPPVKAATRNASTIDVAFGTYQATLSTLMSQGYVVVTDEVAAHAATHQPWFTDNQMTVYKVTMRRATATPTPTAVPTSTPTPVPATVTSTATPTVTPTAVPTRAPSATPTPVPSRTVYQTGITRYATVYVMVAVSLLIIAGATTAVIIYRNKTKNEGDEG